MENEGSPHVIRRTTRSSSSSMPNTPNKIQESKKKVDSCSPSILDDLVSREEHVSLDTLVSNFPGRKLQILDILRLVGPLNSPMLPLYLYGGPSTGKTSVVLQIFRHLKRPFVYSGCRTCYNPRVLFESILNQLALHRRNLGNGYSSAKRCERPADFVTYLQELLTGVITSLKANSAKPGLLETGERASGEMVYLIFDDIELVREWHKHSGIISLLFKLHCYLKIPEVGLIFITNSSPDTYYLDTVLAEEPVHLFFPDYTEDELEQIFLRNQPNPKLYSSFLDAVLNPFCRITRRIDVLSIAFEPLFQKYCKPLSDLGLVPNRDEKRILCSYLNPHIALSTNEVFKVLSNSSLEVEENEEKAKKKENVRKLGDGQDPNDIDFHISISAKYLLISAFLASRNPATLDAALFDSTGGGDNRKRKRKSSETSKEQKEQGEQDLLMKGPGTFPLERLLAIFQCITSVAEGFVEEEQLKDGLLEVEVGDCGLMSDVLLQLSTLCNASFISRGESCPLEGLTRYRSTVSEDMALKVARSLKFPLSKYLYRR